MLFQGYNVLSIWRVCPSRHPHTPWVISLIMLHFFRFHENQTMRAESPTTKRKGRKRIPVLRLYNLKVFESRVSLSALESPTVSQRKRNHRIGVTLRITIKKKTNEQLFEKKEKKQERVNAVMYFRIISVFVFFFLEMMQRCFHRKRKIVSRKRTTSIIHKRIKGWREQITGKGPRAKRPRR